MNGPRTRQRSGCSWTPYAAGPDAPWNLERVVHLHRRAGFAASWEELQRDLADGPEASIQRLLDGKARGEREGVPPGFEATSAVLAESAVNSNDAGRLKAWWFYRILFSPDPLGERLTLLWHDHFATSNLKLDDLGAMHRQNEIFRKLARAPFGALLNAVVRDPTMLIWLDAPTNRKAHPNENLARELLELFTLGIGNYTETDVREAARALTGWTVSEGQFADVAVRQDPGEKTILGAPGRWTGTDLLRILLEQPATAVRLARKLCGLFMGEGVVTEPGILALADDLGRNALDIGRAVALVIRSREFFSESNLHSRVIDPVAFVAGPVRTLGLWNPPPSTLILADWSARLGQDLFYPPNVGGWPGGRNWLSSRSIIGRANFAAALADGTRIGLPGPVDPLGLALRHGFGRDREAVLGFLGVLLTGVEPSAAAVARWSAQLGPRTAWGPEMARRAVALLVASPDGQVA